MSDRPVYLLYGFDIGHVDRLEWLVATDDKWALPQMLAQQFAAQPDKDEMIEALHDLLHDELKPGGRHRLPGGTVLHVETMLSFDDVDM